MLLQNRTMILSQRLYMKTLLEQKKGKGQSNFQVIIKLLASHILLLCKYNLLFTVMSP